MKEKYALVTGGAGFIGSNLTRALLIKGINVVVYDNFSTGSRKNLPEDQGGKLTIIEGNILDLKKLTRIMEGIEVVFHNAARVTIRDSLDNFLEDAETNLMGTINVIKASVDKKVKKFIFASSMAVYGDKESPAKEEDVLKPIVPYGLSKRAAEEYCLYANERYGLNAVILRYFNTYGQNQAISSNVGVINSFIDQLLRGESLTIFGDGDQVRDFVHVDDVVRANLLVLEKEMEAEVFNIGTGRGISINELARHLREKIKTDVKIEHGGSVVSEARYSVADITKAQRGLGYRPRIKLEEGIERTIKWIRENTRRVDQLWNQKL
ncbi:MAG TPA: NAD-dependent epimerase/dehydratase family protein [Candidatus Nanoarchaeia archaeon]|nr:NAD-dependent epimerase/dehydratase family protein [Candidatus Nanoarchaeia archaeon]